MHERHHLTWSARRHEKLVAEADTARALRGLHAPTTRRLRSGAAAFLRAVAARVEPKGTRSLTG